MTAAKRPAAKRPSAKRGAPARRSAAKRPAAKRPAAQRRRLTRLLRGDRPLLAGLVVVAALMLALAWTPLQSYTAAADRADALTAGRDKLAEEVARLEERRDRLSDPEHIELHAREELGLVKPGEVPYVVVTPEREFEPAEPDVEAPAAPGEEPWWRRLGRALAHLFNR